MIMKTLLRITIFSLTTVISVIAAPDSNSFDKLKTEPAMKAGSKGLSITELWNGYSLECRMQNLQAEVTMSGTKIRSTSQSEGTGVFGIQAAKLGRNNLMKNIPSNADFVNADAEAIKSGRGNIVEEYTASGDGIRQDFVIVNKPEGKGKLVLELDVTGADAALAGDAIMVKLTSGRELVYHALNVTDAAGKALEAKFEKAGHCIAVAIDDNGAKYPVRVDPTITDADWTSMGGIPGVNRYVSAVALDSSGNFYVGGAITVAGGIFVNYIAKWNGSAWNALGTGMNNSVTALEVDDSGNLYAGGSFDTAGGVAVHYIAKWNGTAWSALGTGMSGAVLALAFDDSGNIYAGGLFDNAGDIVVNGIARWNGSAWSALGSGISDDKWSRRACYALAFDNYGTLYAAGNFDTIGGIVAYSIAKWDGNTWSALGNAIGKLWLGTHYTATVKAIAFDSSGNLYAGGNFDTADGKDVNCIAKWDGSAWSALDRGIGGSYTYVSDIKFDNAGNLYACGYFSQYFDTASGGIAANHIAKWDGTAWSTLGSGIISGNGLTSIAIDNAGAVYAGGDFEIAGNIAANGVAKWDGSAWSALGKGTNANVRTLVMDGSGNLYAGGNFISIGGVAANHIAKWDGSMWSALGGGLNVSGYVYAITVDNIGNVYAMGNFDTAGGIAANRIAKWDGSAWSALGSGLTTLKSYFSALAVDGSGNIYAGGSYDTAGGLPVNNIAKWDGTAWNALGGGTNGTVCALKVDNSGNLYVGGAFDSAGGILVNQIARWDGSAWSALDSGVGDWWGDGCVYALAMDSVGNLFATGEFDSAGGELVNNIAKWDGTAWSALGIGLNVLMDFDMDEIGAFALAIDNSGTVYAGGDFKEAGGVAVNQMAKWDGSAWSAMGSGIEKLWYGIHSMVTDNSGSIYIGGNFLYAGNKVSPYIAKCNLAGTAVLPDNIANIPWSCPAYNPHSGTVNFNLASAAQVAYYIYTLSGRQVLQASQAMNAGNHVLRINANKIARGMYILHLKAGNVSMRSRMIIDK